MVRTRTNQPVGWTDSQSSIKHYRLKNHDYDYYPASWVTPDGKHFEEGYYDENGQHYRNLFVPGSTMMLVCEYCGNHMMYTCKEGDLPVCNGCGARFTADVTDQAPEEPYAGQAAETAERPNVMKWVLIIAALYLGSLLVRGMWHSLAARIVRPFSEYPAAETRTVTSPEKESIYVNEIGRTCYLDGEDWYDSVTDCWFWFNDETAPYQWQYWYEGISSDYGDHGWMEYDMDSGQWYIEVRDGDWEVLPDRYDTSGLWHFTDEYVNPFP
ncbi:MAG: hypothetical protein K6E50_06775 [Lachnospiraceae bacterium]|nr:hypothetical protein [Lachnospiraceae bacterium]